MRHATEADLADILSIHRSAFPDESVADLTLALLADPTARPLTSLVAVADNKVVGHILFTAAHLQPETTHRISILAPLAVMPEYQGLGIGGNLISEGLSVLACFGVSIVFVLGHPAYYPRHGFRPAGELGFAAPYPIPEKDARAWMAQGLGTDLPKPYAGTVRCAKVLDHPEHWQE
jgi:putative acetyltransferase